MADIMTLPEYAKGLPVGAPERPYIESFVERSDILQALPFSGFTGAAYEGYRETSIGSAGFRAINEDAGTSQGKMEPFQETSFPIDVDLSVDKAIVLRHGEERRSREESMQMKAQATLFTSTFISGDNSSNPKEFSGLKARCTAGNGRLFHNSAASGGAALSLYNLDTLLNNVANANVIIAGFDLMPRFIQAARNTALSGFVIQTWDQVGTPKMTYAGKRILFGYPRDRHSKLLPFTEVASGGGSAVTTSLFAANFAEDGVHGIQLKNIEVKDYGLTRSSTKYITNVSWDVGLVAETDYCVGRLDSITDAAFVA
jgi:hypothetical protein